VGRVGHTSHFYIVKERPGYATGTAGGHLVTIIVYWPTPFNFPVDGIVSGCSSKNYEATTHPFLLRIWLEEIVEDTGSVLWRGCITHVPSRKTYYFQELSQLIEFLEPYILVLGNGSDP
jgi:hypothetical protein